MAEQGVAPVPPADFLIQHEGSIALLYPNSDEARAWVEQHIPLDAPRHGRAIAVEARYIDDIAFGINNDGLSVEV